MSHTGRLPPTAALLLVPGILDTLSPYRTGKLARGGRAAEGWTSGPGGRTARPGWGQRSDTVWALHLNQEAGRAVAVNPEHREHVSGFNGQQDPEGLTES